MAVHKIEQEEQDEKKEAEENGQEEVKARIEQEVLMTKDPALGYVPVERLIKAEVQTREMAAGKNGRIQSGFSWTERGPNNIGGRSRAVLIDQNDATGNTVLVGSVSGGLWRTTNFKSATPAWSQIGSVSTSLAIACIAQDPNNLNNMYAGTGEGYSNYDYIRGLGIYKSTDGGLTWALLPSTTTGGGNVNDFNYVQKILVYTNGDVYAAGISAINCNRGGILRSTNGGSTWTRVIGNYTGGGVCSNAFDFLGYDIVKSVSGDLYASVYDASTADTTRGKIYRSPAGATVGNTGTWTDITPPPPAASYWQRIELACSPANNNRIYALLQGTGGSIGGIRRTDDGGSTWVNIDNTTAWCDPATAGIIYDFARNQAWYNLTLAVKPDDDQTVMAAGVDIMRSTNAGTAWAQLTQWAGGCGSLPYVHADIHDIVYFPGSTTEFLVVCDGGVFYTADGGATFSNRDLSLDITQYYSCAIHPATASNYMYGGSQDNGTHKFTAGGINSVTTVLGGDGGFSFIDQDDPTYQIGSYTKANYVISRDGGASFTVSTNLGIGRFINPADYDNTQNILYACGNAGDLVRITNITSGALTASALGIVNSANYSVSAVKVDPNTANRVWVAFSGNGTANVAPMLIFLDNANDDLTVTGTQVALPAGLGTTNNYISSIDVENGDANHVLLTISNYGVASVWQTTDGGATWTSLDNNGVNLPDMPVRWGMFIPANTTPGLRTTAVGGILLATEMGVWSTSAINGTSTLWSSNNTGMGNVRTDMLKLRTADNVVVAATHGRGLFTTTLFTGSLSVTFRSFTGKAQPKYNDLFWETDNEQNNKGFSIERRYEGDPAFTSIGFVNGKNGADMNSYTYRDQSVDVGKAIAYYRLRQIDLDGKSMYSPVISLSRSASGKWLEYVSVTGNSLYMRISGSNSSETLQLNLFDATGKLIKKTQLPFQSQTVDVGALPAGVYVMRLTSPGHQTISQKIVKR